MNNKRTGRTKTPIEIARGRIKTAGVIAFISAGITLFAIAFAVLGHSIISGINAYALFDVLLLIVLAVLLLSLKSRVAAIALLVYFVGSKVLQFVDEPETIRSGVWLTLVFVSAYINGVIGAFEFQKLRKQHKAEAFDATDAFGTGFNATNPETTVREETQNIIAQERKNSGPQDPGW
jgi:hypothetical protein